MTTFQDASTARIDPLLRERWSPRIYDVSHTLSGADLDRLLEAARWAPSAGNSQPWAFIATLRGERAHDLLLSRLSRGNAEWVPRASAFLISLHRTGHPDDPELTYSDYAAYDLGQAVAHLTIQAQSMGLHSHQFAGFDHDGVAADFGVPAHWRVTTGIAVGRRADADVRAEAAPEMQERESRPRERRPVTEFVFGDRFGVPR